MSCPARPVTIALLGTPEVSGAMLYGFYDALAGTRRDWQLLHGGSPTESPLHPLVVSADGQPFVGANGVRITPDASFGDCPRPDVVCLVDLAIAPDAPMPAHYDEAARWLRGAWDAGATLACACSGALLLAKTGLLDNRDATTHWAYRDRLIREHPSTRWHADRGLVLSDPDGRIVMAGSGVAWHILVLTLIARFASPKDAMHVARINLFDTNQTSPMAYASLTCGGRADDDMVAHCQLWAASNYRVGSPVAQMATISGLPERTFKRRFQLATGMNPLEYIHRVRLEEAKQMLEATDFSIEAIAEEVGYQDASFFARLFIRNVMMTPAQYRRRFGALGAELRRAAQKV